MPEPSKIPIGRVAKLPKRDRPKTPRLLFACGVGVKVLLRGLKKPVARRGYSTVAISKEGQPHSDLLAGQSGDKIALHGGMDVQTGSRIIRCRIERRIEVRDPPSRMVVVSHKIDPIDVLSNPRPPDIGSPRLCGSSNRKKVRARLRHGPLVKLPPELGN